MCQVAVNPYHAGYFMYYTPPKIIFNLQDFSHQHSRVKNSVDPDQLASKKAADLDLHSFQNRMSSGLA